MYKRQEQGRFSPEYDEEQTVTIPCKHVIFSVGQAIEWDNMLDNLDLKRRPNGGALADKLTYQTSEPDIFVGGDVYTGPRFAIDAIAAGREGEMCIRDRCKSWFPDCSSRGLRSRCR